MLHSVNGRWVHLSVEFDRWPGCSQLDAGAGVRGKGRGRGARPGGCINRLGSPARTDADPRQMILFSCVNRNIGFNGPTGGAVRAYRFVDLPKAPMIMIRCTEARRDLTFLAPNYI
ncbi:hypothetical protein EVAR_43766_1 [Eumeta japonica]|uniref:Uncharacterized protein n=1 Tax=Eumeta variegata TaxID=151549 RepID=A0A4C1XHY3_EUMVA|nr:hypothetical protein EVAR_43766_1 [Eumeta japonica]